MTDWIAVDWGTSRLRAWLMDSTGQAVTMLSSPQGMSTLLPDQFEAALLALVSEHLLANKTTLVVCCGMVGARQGWREADYVAVPCSAAILQKGVTVGASDQRLKVIIQPGIKQASPADVMRGEETQIAGYMKLHPDFSGVICLPGTHTKWVSVSQQKILRFSTCMTGELFSLLSQSSVLKHSVTSEGWDQPAFLESVKRTVADSGSISCRLFRLRAETLLNDLPTDTARSQLSGMLIGQELHSEKSCWQKQAVVIIGASLLVEHYASALELLGVATQQVNGDQMTLAGLVSAYQQIQEHK